MQNIRSTSEIMAGIHCVIKFDPQPIVKTFFLTVDNLYNDLILLLFQISGQCPTPSYFPFCLETVTKCL